MALRDFAPMLEAQLGPLGLDPAQFDMGYEPQKPMLRSTEEAYHPGLRGKVERYGPALLSALSAGDYESPLARIAARLGGAAGEYLSSGVKSRASDIETANRAEIARTDQLNDARRSTVTGNRDQYRKLWADRMPTPREVVERKTKEAADRAAATATAGEQARINTRRANGLNPTGTPTTKTPKTPKPWSATSFRLFGDADKIALDELENELKGMKADYSTAQAFQPQRRDKSGNPLPEAPNVAAARERVNAINRQIHETRKSAVLFHLQQLGAEVAADPATAKAKLAEVYRSAQVLKLDKDPDVDAAAKAVGSALLKAKGGQ